MKNRKILPTKKPNYMLVPQALDDKNKNIYISTMQKNCESQALPIRQGISNRESLTLILSGTSSCYFEANFEIDPIPLQTEFTGLE